MKLHAARFRQPGSARTAPSAPQRIRTQYLAEIDSGRQENVPAPEIAIDYWKLPPGARLREVVVAVRADEAKHRDVNHEFADELNHVRHTDVIK